MLMVTDGKTSRRIGIELDLSSRTVEIHRAAAMAKMGCASLAGFVRIAMRLESVGAVRRVAKRTLYKVVSGLMAWKLLDYCEATMAVAA